MRKWQALIYLRSKGDYKKILVYKWHYFVKEVKEHLANIFKSKLQIVANKSFLYISHFLSLNLPICKF